jgi:hypothetical protein
MRLPNLGVGRSRVRPGAAAVRAAACDDGDGGDELSCAGTSCYPGGPRCRPPCRCLCSTEMLTSRGSDSAALTVSGCRCQ